LASTTSTAHSSVAAKIIASPRPRWGLNAVPNPPDNTACPTTSKATAPNCSAPSRSPSTLTASSATQTTSVLLMNCACAGPDVACASLEEQHERHAAAHDGDRSEPRQP
jgi:hypothetical protein